MTRVPTDRWTHARTGMMGRMSALAIALAVLAAALFAVAAVV
jgi:hypothetical protein